MTNFLDSHFGKGANDQFGTKCDDLTRPWRRPRRCLIRRRATSCMPKPTTLIKLHVPMVPVAHGGSATAWKATVEGAHSSPLGNERCKVLQCPGQDTFVWMQNAEPLSLYCADETDGESLRACEQIFESLLAYEIGSTEVEPGLAEMPRPMMILTEWTFTLRDGVKFSDGDPLTAKMWSKTYVVQWDAADPLHAGNTGDFTYWSSLFAAS